jgi:hypothetical protein
MQTSISKKIPVEVASMENIFFVSGQKKAEKVVVAMPATACGHRLYHLSRLPARADTFFQKMPGVHHFAPGITAPQGDSGRPIGGESAARESKRLEIKAKFVLWIEKMLNLQTQHSKNLIRRSLKVYFFSGISQQSTREEGSC